MKLMGRLLRSIQTSPGASRWESPSPSLAPRVDVARIADPVGIAMIHSNREIHALVSPGAYLPWQSTTS